jgi:hypothetical protein
MLLLQVALRVVVQVVGLAFVMLITLGEVEVGVAQIILIWRLKLILV